MKNWQSPHFEELTMSAEVGAYQEDYGEDPRPFGEMAHATQAPAQPSADGFNVETAA